MKELENWEKSTQELADKFIDKYHPDHWEWVWSGDVIGANIIVDEHYFWSMDNVIDAFKLDIPKDTLFKWHDLALEAFHQGKSFQNLKNYALYGLIKTD